MKGQADDLGGGVFKKRLNENQHDPIRDSSRGLLCDCYSDYFIYCTHDV